MAAESECRTLPSGRIEQLGSAQDERRPVKLCFAVAAWFSLAACGMAGELTATGHDQCIYLRWDPVGGGSVYAVERGPGEDGPWERITPLI